jgi:hypothetical protein
MTFLAPGFLYVAMTAAAAVVALHFIMMRQPRSSVLPTARFVPDTQATTLAAAKRPSDLLLMLLRVATLLAAGAALAKPIVQPSRRAQGKVVLVDVSRSIADSMALRASARSVYSDGDAVILFDSSARLNPSGTTDSLRELRPSNERGNLSAALVGALRAASDIAERADSIELVIVSAFAKEEFDAATDSIRALWPGAARLVQVPGTSAAAVAATSRISTNAPSTDPLAITATLVGPHAASNVFLNRTETGSATSGQATGSPALISIDWPESARPPGAISRIPASPHSPIPASIGLVSGATTVIAPFVRQWSYPPDSLHGAEVIARWVDGEPAAIEKRRGDGCVRSVAIPVTPIGDLAIRKDFVELVQSLAAPCARQTALIAAAPATVATLSGSGGLASRSAFRPRVDVQSPIAPWLFILALLTAVAELFVRRRSRPSSASSTVPVTPARAA